MFLGLICYHGSLQKCKQYRGYIIILITCFLIIFQSHEYLFIMNKKPDLLLVKGISIDLRLSMPMTTEVRSRTLNGNCAHSHTAVYDITKHTPVSLIRAHPSLDAALLPLQSNSLIYCAVPKIASKTLVSLMIYTYVRDIIDYPRNKLTNIDRHRTRAEQRINVPKLIEQLRKVWQLKKWHYSKGSELFHFNLPF